MSLKCVHMSISSKNLLVVSHRYRSFQKDPIDLVSPYFGNIYVLVRFNKFADISKYVHVPALQPFISSSKIDYTNKPSNLDVYKTSMFNLPLDSQYKKLGDLHLSVVEKIIGKNNLSFDLIHSHFIWSAGYVGAKLKEKYNVPFVVTAHGYDIYDLPFRDDEWKSKIEYVLNSADAIITVSNSNLKCIKKLDVNTPVTVLPNGYREDLFHPIDLYESRRSLSLPSNKKVILSVGNLEEIKGHKYLIEAMANVVKERKDVICYIVGGGKLKSKLNKQIVSAGLQEHVKLVGSKPHSEIPLWMNACDIFVLPSLNEGNPTVMFECLGCGKPFIGTKVGGVPEIIVSDDYGLLCDPAKPKELTETILLSLDKNWNSNLITKYSAHFTWDKISKQILDIYSFVQ